MKAKDTVMSDDEILEVCKKAVSEGKHRPSELCQAQAEISFKAGYDEGYLERNDQFGERRYRAGVKEMVEWLRIKEIDNDCEDCGIRNSQNFAIDYKDWQAKLKEWGISSIGG